MSKFNQNIIAGMAVSIVVSFAVIGCNSGGTGGQASSINTPKSENGLTDKSAVNTAESNLYTWVSGESAMNAAGVYGTKGLASVNNYPKARTSYAMWRDTSGNIWVFGGESGTSNYARYYNDLWKYDPTNKTWTWVSGSNTPNVAGVYGTKGVEAAANTPGSRSQMYSWTDKDGNLWLFGGTSYVGSTGYYYNDLWKFNTKTLRWVWMAGTNNSKQPSTYSSTVGAESSGNTPGSRYLGTTWTDESGNLWLFGGTSIETGTGNTTGSYYTRNDVWRFNVASSKWALMSPLSTAQYYSSSGGATNAVYGTKGVEAPANTPSGRQQVPSTWTGKSGYLWLFGGQQYSGSKSKNELWRYNVNTRQWAFMGGGIAGNEPGTYGTFAVESATNIPGARILALSWTDKSGNLWLFGGGGYAASTSGVLADLWRYNPTTGMWAWMGGTNTAGTARVSGTKGVTSLSSFIGARSGGKAVTDESGNAWIYAGTSPTSNSLYSDLWTIKPYVAPLPPTTGPLENVPVGSFGLQSFVITNTLSSSVTLSFPNSLPTDIVYDTLPRTTCLVNGSQVLAPNQSCTVALKYIPKIEGVSDSLNFNVMGTDSSGQKSVVSVLKLVFSSRITTAKFAGVADDISRNVIGLTVVKPDTIPYAVDSLSNVPVGSFGLKSFKVTNISNGNIYGLTLPAISNLASGLYYDDTRSTCKLDNKQMLKPNQSCLLVLKYQPTAKGVSGNIDLKLLSVDNYYSVIVNSTPLTVPYSSRN